MFKGAYYARGQQKCQQCFHSPEFTWAIKLSKRINRTPRMEPVFRTLLLFTGGLLLFRSQGKNQVV